MKTVLGQGSASDGGYQVAALSPQQEALVVLRPVPPNASRATYLRYELGSVPRNLEIFLAWRRTDRPGASSFTRLPFVSDGAGVVTVSDHPDWSGPIEELALFFAPAPQLSPRIVDFEPMRVDSLTLEPQSLSMALSSQWTSWSAFRPWSIMSVSSLGYNKDGDVIEGISLQLVVGLSLVVTLGLLCVFFRRRQPQVMIAGAVMIAVVIGDLLWVNNLSRQLELTRKTYGGLSADSVIAAQSDGVLAEGIESLVSMIDTPETARVFIQAPTRYLALRAAWHLLPLNVYERPPNDVWMAAPDAGADFLLSIETDDERVEMDPLPPGLRLQSVGRAPPMTLYRMTKAEQ